MHVHQTEGQQVLVVPGEVGGPDRALPVHPDLVLGLGGDVDHGERHVHVGVDGLHREVLTRRVDSYHGGAVREGSE